MRWSKTPEWLLTSLLGAPRTRFAATPGNALLAYTTLHVRFADWRTMRARCSHQELGDAMGLSRGSAGRCLDALEAIGAVALVGSRDGWRGRREYQIAVDAPLLTGEQRAEDARTCEHDARTGEQRASPEPVAAAGSRRALVSITTQTQESSPDEPDADVWGELVALRPAQEVLTGERAALPAWVHGPDKVGAAQREWRAAARQPDAGGPPRAGGADPRQGTFEGTDRAGAADATADGTGTR